MIYKKCHKKTTVGVTIIVIGIINIIIQWKHYNNILNVQSGKGTEPMYRTFYQFNSKDDHKNKSSNLNLHNLNMTFKTDISEVFDCVTWLPHQSRSSMTNPQQYVRYSLKTFEKWKGVKEDSGHRFKTFQKIFDKRDWLASDQSNKEFQASGPGALLVNAQNAMAALHVIITILKKVLNKKTIKLLDVPCGDLQWMKQFLVSRTDVQYHAIDIVPDIINHHKKRYGHVTRLRFTQADIVNEDLNESYDLILSRDLLQHLTVKDAGQVLKRFSNSHSSFLLITTHPDTDRNADIEVNQLGGRFSRYNLEIKPFSLVPPICTSYDYNREHLALWALPLTQSDDN